MDIRKVKKLIELLEASPDVGEIEIHEDKEMVRIQRQAPASVVASSPMVVTPPAATAPPPAAVPSEAAAAPAEAPQESAEGNVTAPMVGTFFSAPSPDSAPFVQVGDKVEKGDVLCIIEAMKIMNQIDAPNGGVVKKIYAENGDPVEFGQPLMQIL